MNGFEIKRNKPTSFELLRLHNRLPNGVRIQPNASAVVHEKKEEIEKAKLILL